MKSGDGTGLIQRFRKSEADWENVQKIVIFSGSRLHLKEEEEERHSMPVAKYNTGTPGGKSQAKYLWDQN